MTPEWLFKHWRARQFINKPELPRANLVSEFAILTVDGQRVSPRELAGKVVLVHFWATTCDTCSRALPRLREITKKFQDQPFVMLSVNVDHDERAWRTFLEKNNVPGLQYRDGFNGAMAQAFGVGVNFHSNADQVISGAGGPMNGVWKTSWGMKEDVPKTFTIDRDGVLQEEKLSDALISKLQELIGHAEQNQAAK